MDVLPQESMSTSEKQPNEPLTFQDDLFKMIPAPIIINNNDKPSHFTRNELAFSVMEDRSQKMPDLPHSSPTLSFTTPSLQQTQVDSQYFFPCSFMAPIFSSSVVACLEKNKIIATEVQSIINLMRLNSRWKSGPRFYQRGRASSDDMILIQLMRLRHRMEIMTNEEAEVMSPQHYLPPFLDIILSPIANGPITSMAFSSIFKFLHYRFLSTQYHVLDSIVALERIVHAVTNCHFEAIDSEVNFILFFKILKLLTKCTQLDISLLLSENALYEMVQACFKLSTQSYAIPNLRKLAETALIEMFQFIFFAYNTPQKRQLEIWFHAQQQMTWKTQDCKDNSNQPSISLTSNVFSDLQTSLSPANVTINRQVQNNEPIRLNNSRNVPTLGNVTAPLSLDDDLECPNNCNASLTSSADANVNTQPICTMEQRAHITTVSHPDLTTVTSSQTPRTHQKIIGDLPSLSSSLQNLPLDPTYTLITDNVGHTTRPQEPLSPHIPFDHKCLTRLLNFLYSLINPNNNATTEITHYFGLSIILSIFEVMGSKLAEIPQLLDTIANDLCRYLIQTLKTPETSLSIFTLTIRACYYIFSSTRRKLRFQLEIFLLTLINAFPKDLFSSEEKPIIMTAKKSSVINPTNSISSPSSISKTNTSSSNSNGDISQPPQRQKTLNPTSNDLKQSASISTKKPVDASPSLRTQNQNSTQVQKPNVHNESYLGMEYLEVALDAMVQLCKSPLFVSDLLVMYDCQIHGSNIIQQVIEFFYRYSYPQNRIVESNRSDTQQQLKTYIHCLAYQGLITIVGIMAKQPTHLEPFHHYSLYSTTKKGEPHSIPSLSDISKRLLYKRILLTGIEKFNKNPNDGLQYLQMYGVLPTPFTADSVAQFLKLHPTLDKAQVGLFFGSRKVFNTQVLTAYCYSFDFESLSFINLLRQFIESFRLPGESAVIERILDIWCIIYYKKTSMKDNSSSLLINDNDQPISLLDGETGGSDEINELSSNLALYHHPLFKSIDACYLVCMSVIVLNVDLYNPNVKAHRRMTIDHYVHNLKGQNGPNRENFPSDLLRAIYKSIREREIKISEEDIKLEGKIRRSTWYSLLKKQSKCQLDEHLDEMLDAASGGFYDPILFDLIWHPLIDSIKAAFRHSFNLEELDDSSTLFYLCGHLAMRTQNYAAMNYLLITLADITTIMDPATAAKQRIITSTSAATAFEKRFIKDKKVEIVISILFNLARQYTNLIREAWISIVQILIQLHQWDLLPSIMESEEDILDSELSTSMSNFNLTGHKPTSMIPNESKMNVKPSKSNSNLNPNINSNMSPIMSLVSNFWNWSTSATIVGGTGILRGFGRVNDHESQFKNQCKERISKLNLPDIIQACACVHPDTLYYLLNVLVNISMKGLNFKNQPQIDRLNRDQSPATKSRTKEELIQQLDITTLNQSPSSSSLRSSSSCQSSPSCTSSSNLENPISFESATDRVDDCSRKTFLDPKHLSTDTNQYSKMSRPSSRLPSKSTSSLSLLPVQLPSLILMQSSVDDNISTTNSISIFCLDLMTHLLLLNVHRLNCIWPIYSNHLYELILKIQYPSPVVEQAIVNLLLSFGKLLPTTIQTQCNHQQPISHNKLRLDEQTNKALSNPISDLQVESNHCNNSTFMIQMGCQIMDNLRLDLGLIRYYAHITSHTAAVIFTRNAPILASLSASSQEWKTMLDLTMSLMSSSSEYLEDFLDILINVLIQPKHSNHLSTPTERNGADTTCSGDLVGESIQRMNDDYHDLVDSQQIDPTNTLISSSNALAVVECVHQITATTCQVPLDIILKAMDTIQLLFCIIPYILSSHVLPLENLSPSNHKIAPKDDSVTQMNEIERLTIETYLIPMFQVMTQISTHDPRIVVRHNALTHLQKLFLSPSLHAIASPSSLLNIFERVLFPLMQDIIEQQNSQDNGTVMMMSSREAVEETQLRATSILCKTFLHSIVKLNSQQRISLWEKVIIYFETYMTLGNSETLSEAMTESIKNVMLVLTSTGVILPLPPSIKNTDTNPEIAVMLQHNEKGEYDNRSQLNYGDIYSDEEKNKYEMWNMTWKLIDRFAPSLKPEQFILKAPTSPSSATLPNTNNPPRNSLTDDDLANGQNSLNKMDSCEQSNVQLTNLTAPSLSNHFPLSGTVIKL